MKPPSFPLYVNNWFGSSRVSAMLPEQEGAYIRLLCHQWNSGDEQAVPGDHESLAALSRLNGRWDQLGSRILKCFDKLPDGSLRNEKLHTCWIEAMAYRAKQSVKGKASAAARAQHSINHGSTAVQPDSQPQGNSDTESESESLIETENISMSVRLRSEFENCWKLYPDKNGKQKALVAYMKWRKAGDTQADVLSGINRYMEYVKAKRHMQPGLNYQNGQTWFWNRAWTSEYICDAPDRQRPPI